MKNYNTIELFDNGPLVILKLNRPEKRNALNSEMISELTDAFQIIGNSPQAVLLNIVGKGNAFCAGADIKWLSGLKEASLEEIQKSFLALAEMLKTLYELPQVTLAMVHGAVYGGGIGLMAACDYVIGAPDAVFSFSEIKLGLVPATISPYIQKRTGLHQMKKLFLKGNQFNEGYAEKIGLIDEVANKKPGDLNYQTMVELLLMQPHHALKAMKKLFRGLEEDEIGHTNQHGSSRLVAELVKTKETQVLFDKFLANK